MKNRSPYKLTLLVLLSLFLNMCNKEELPISQSKDDWNLPYFGFNAKGNLEVEQQTTYTNSYFDQIISENIKSNLAIRVTGGTASQITYPADWVDENINKWVSLQKKQGIRFIYVVNGNDSPASQAQFIKKWINAGARFDFIEMMNEYYLPKFLKGDTSQAEVSTIITPEKYVDTILPTYWKELDQFKLPYYLIFAPERTTPNQILEHWNKVVADAINTTYPNRQLHATLHLYIDSDSSISHFNYGQIDHIRNELPINRHIAITEAGIVNRNLNYQESAEISIKHYKQIIAHLHTGDYLLDQILYNTSMNNNTANLNPIYNGETPKGVEMLQFIENKLK